MKSISMWSKNKEYVSSVKRTFSSNTQSFYNNNVVAKMTIDKSMHVFCEVSLYSCYCDCDIMQIEKMNKIYFYIMQHVLFLTLQQ